MEFLWSYRRKGVVRMELGLGSPISLPCSSVFLHVALAYLSQDANLTNRDNKRLPSSSQHKASHRPKLLSQIAGPLCGTVPSQTPCVNTILPRGLLSPPTEHSWDTPSRAIRRSRWSGPPDLLLRMSRSPPQVTSNEALDRAEGFPSRLGPGYANIGSGDDSSSWQDHRGLLGLLKCIHRMRVA
jgi:hypothetical protein